MVLGSKGLGCVGILALLIGAAVATGGVWYVDRANEAERQAYRRDGAAPIRPPFLREPLRCRLASPAEVALDQALLQTARAANIGNGAPAQRYPVSYFAWHWALSGGSVGRCPPADRFFAPLAPILDRQGWPEANAELNDLRLATRLSPSSVRARALAHISFLGWIPPSDLQGEDARPYARMLLADQGRFARPWRAAAFTAMGGDTRLGTSAAYLAVAVDPVTALPRVGAIMTDKLRRSRANMTSAYHTGGDTAAIRPDDANRLIELGYALARGHGA